MILKRFEGEEESSFRAQYAEHSIPFIRVSIPIAILLYLSFMVWDYAIDPTAIGFSFMIRAGFSLIALGVFGLTFHPYFLGREQPVLCTAVILAATGVLAMLYVLPSGFTHGISGVLLVIMYAFGFFRLLFSTAILAFASIMVIANGFLFFGEADRFTTLNANFFLVSASIIGLGCAFLLEWIERRTYEFEIELKKEKEASDSMLRSFLPDRIVDRLKKGEQHIAESSGEATVLFADIIGFTSLAGRLAPGHLVEILGDVFTRLDELAEEEGVEKVKTIGDSYMVVSGVSLPSRTSAQAIAEFALRAMIAVDEYAEKNGLPLQMTMGMATGAVVSGVIGAKVPIFDLWGETVNLASRLQTEGIEGAIQVSESTYWRLHNDYDLEERGVLNLKGGISVTAFILKGRKKEGAVDAKPGKASPTLEVVSGGAIPDEVVSNEVKV
ncbi:MAG: adenylate/guanylate cyclase domain-containing protein [Rhodospirillales bacterium]|nr:adenylate/guanylate cyclase domain-containing protein [Rhodospirillales bacterium]MCW8861659.1 adenylate/guanylate cyclase domain-containing protein [Rhodospirillales bacterium]MCW8952313.1 adenylate/guanylate cyclase domain-containing protein [Rhodospirillales bacterium]MCW8970476.1 adenylate/guanylate cyclase domain-containing protein [Rhodospirillales bacterium]MCW9003581.1 adenylate/guanylate cyclase domain-containing protein [Rhodospirillales bacterium]